MDIKELKKRVDGINQVLFIIAVFISGMIASLFLEIIM